MFLFYFRILTIVVRSFQILLMIVVRGSHFSPFYLLEMVRHPPEGRGGPEAAEGGDPLGKARCLDASSVSPVLDLAPPLFSIPSPIPIPIPNSRSRPEAEPKPGVAGEVLLIYKTPLSKNITPLQSLIISSQS